MSFDPNLHTFTIVGSEGRPQAVKLFPKQSCTCPATSTCYHILAAKLSIGLETPSSSKQILNLTQLRRNARSRKEKRSGRKCPRPGDYSVEPAPDALVDGSQTKNTTVLSGIQSRSAQLSEGSQKKSDGHGSKKRPFAKVNQSSTSSKRVCPDQQSCDPMNSDFTHSTCTQTSSRSKSPAISSLGENQTKYKSEHQTMKINASGSNIPKSNKHVSNGEPTDENGKHVSCKFNKYACFYLLSKQIVL